MERFLPILGLLVLGLTLYVNYLAGTGYLNNITTGEVSARFPTLFTPAGFTFAIWGVIYLLNVLFVFYQLYKMLRDPAQLDVGLVGLFILICLTNAVWIFTWHLLKIGLALLLMLVILTLLVAAYRRVRGSTPGSGEYFFEKINFSVYLGWISVATVANTAILFISKGLFTSGLIPALFTGVIIIVVAALALWIILKEGDIFFGLVILWASYGIVMARSAEQTDYAAAISVVALVAMILIFFSMLIRLFLKKRANSLKKS